MTHALELVQHAVELAKKAGATEADAIMYDTRSLSIGQRMRQPETIEQSSGSALGLRVWAGRQVAVVSSSDVRRDMLGELAERAVFMARATPEDPFTALPADGLLERNPLQNLELDDHAEPTAEDLIALVQEAEEVALSVSGITNSDGAEAGFSRGSYALATSHGFSGSYSAASYSLSVCVIAGSGEGMERDYDYHTTRRLKGLKSPEAIGREAARRALSRLQSRKLDTGTYPILFEPRVARGLLGQFASAISGASIARGTSFLKDTLNQAVFAEGIRIVDEPHRVGGLASRPYDGEGVKGQTRAIVDDGVITTWLLDTRSANQLGMTSTGHASRSIASHPTPAPTNFYLDAGKDSPEALMKQMGRGVLITDVFGMGVNLVTGDYSQGAAGFWIENGEIAYPVSEITVAGTLQEMFKTLIPANDLVFEHRLNAPTILIPAMMVAGN